MNQLMRQRIELCIAYHEGVAEQQAAIAEQTPAPAEGEEATPEQAEAAQAQVVADMHAGAAQQLKDVLASFPLSNAIEDARQAPARLYRNSGPMRVGPGFVSTGLIH